MFSIEHHHFFSLLYILEKTKNIFQINFQTTSTLKEPNQTEKKKVAFWGKISWVWIQELFFDQNYKRLKKKCLASNIRSKAFILCLMNKTSNFLLSIQNWCDMVCFCWMWSKLWSFKVGISSFWSKFWVNIRLSWDSSCRSTRDGRSGPSLENHTVFTTSAAAQSPATNVPNPSRWHERWQRQETEAAEFTRGSTPTIVSIARWRCERATAELLCKYPNHVSSNLADGF